MKLVATAAAAAALGIGLFEMLCSRYGLPDLLAFPVTALACGAFGGAMAMTEER